jgi:signal transduction histidine kinase
VIRHGGQRHTIVGVRNPAADVPAMPHSLSARIATAPRGLAATLASLPRGLAARVAAMPRRRQAFLADAGLALALAAVNVGAILPYREQLHPAWGPVLLVVAQAVPLAWRRRFPILVALIIGAARVSYDQLGFGFAPFPLGPVIAFYTIIELRGRAWRWITIVLSATAIGISEASPAHDQPYDTVIQAFIFATAWGAGLLSRATRANLLAARARAERAEAELDAESARAAEVERTRIARELHDVVAHHVSLMAVQAEAAASLLPGKPEQAGRSVQIVGDTARQALTELRRLLGVLRAPAEPLQTTPAASLADLGPVLDQVRGAGLPVELDVLGAPYPLAPSIDATAFRIVQEALTNTLRHTAAPEASVTLRYEPGYVTVAVTDRGPRRDRAAAINGSGLGLAGIAERVASCGGNLAVGPTAEDGFAVTARLPAR